MKKAVYTFIILLIGIGAIHSQSVGINTTTPDPSAALDVSDVTKGLLIPRMTITQRNAIPTPAKGLMVFQTDGTSGFYYYDGSIWVYFIPNSAQKNITGTGIIVTGGLGATLSPVTLRLDSTVIAKFLTQSPAKDSIQSAVNLTSLIQSINQRVKYTDTASMLSPYLRKVDTASLSNRINTKLNATDTASLSNRINTKLNATDTASLSNRINTKLTATDTASLSNRINTKLNASDTASLSNRINTKLNASDTASLSNRINTKLTATDTASLSNRINTKLNATDTASLSNRINTKLNATDTASLSNRINTKLNATDTASLSNRINTKLFSTDTASLSNRINTKLNATDTASLSNRINTKLNSTDTASLSNRINTKLTKSELTDSLNTITLSKNNTRDSIILSVNGRKYAVKDSTGSAGGFFKVSTTNHIIYSDATNYGKNFLVNADSVNWKSGPETKMMLVPSKNAFRVGTVDSKIWNADSIGYYSIAMGYSTAAKGVVSTSIGNQTKAYGYASTSMGDRTTAIADYSTAMGKNTTAKSYGEVAIGTYNDTLNAVNAYAFVADTNRLFTIGNGTSTTPKTAFVIQQNGKVGINTRIADTQLHVKGGFKYVDGNQAAGKVLTSDANGVASWQTAGSGGFFKVSTADANHIIYSDMTNKGKNFIVNADSANFNTANGNENKMFFNSNKAAFRAGAINDKSWDKDSIGQFSFAAGSYTKAKGVNSTALGDNTKALGYASTAINRNSTATGDYSLAGGSFSTAIGSQSIAFGNNAVAKGNNSVAFGEYDSTIGYSSLAVGSNTKAIGNYSIVGGNNSKAIGDYSVALGNNSVAKGVGSFALGQSDSANGSQSVAMGNYTRAAGNYSFAIGNGNNALGDQSVAMGNNTSALGVNSLTIGNSAVAKGQNAVAIGQSDSAKGDNSIALGTSTKAIASNSFSMGQSTIASGSNSIAGGTSSYTNNYNSFAFGQSDSAKGSQSVAFGSNTVSSGTNSFTQGNNTKASGSNDVAMGSNTKASGNSSVAMGEYTTASGYTSTALGTNNTASGYASTSMGSNSTASGSNSITIGSSNTASGSNSITIGANNTASSFYSIAMGINTTASGQYSTALGNSTKASGYYSTALGNYTKAQSNNEMTIGAFNDTLKAYNATAWVGDTNRLFTVGNGTSTTPKTAFVIQQNGYTGVNTHVADTQFHVKGGFKYVDGNQAAGKVLTSDSNGVAKWTTASGGGFFKVSVADTNHIIYSDATKYGKNFIVNADSINWKSGYESKIMLIPSKIGAFRAGVVNTKNWDNDSIGVASFASGANTKAKGSSSTAMGNSTTASGSVSTAMGYNTTASGYATTAMGSFTNAQSTYEMTIGAYNDTLKAFNSSGWAGDTNRVFTVGNGTFFSPRTAFVIQQNGYTGVNTHVADTQFHVKGGFKYEDGNQAAGKVLTSDANGVASWQTASGGSGSSFFKVSTADTNHIIYSDMSKKAKNFIVGADSVNNNSGNNEYKMMFVPSKGGAFRAGYIDYTNWDIDSLGFNSYAIGHSTKASGSRSTAMGEQTIASASKSTAMGAYTIASGESSIAMGNGTTASAFASTAMGANTTASAFASTSIGAETKASGVVSTAMGSFTTASGDNSTALGNNTKAQSNNEMTIGAFNDTLKAYNATAWAGDTNRVFTVGNGTSTAPKTAFVIQQNGYTGINTHVADTQLHVKGGFKYVDGNQAAGKILTSDANGVASWQTASGGSGGGFFKVSTADTNHIIYSDATKYGKNFLVNTDSINWGSATEFKMMFIPSRYGAFRVGYLTSNNWNLNNIGYSSFAANQSTIAKGFGSSAFGNQSSALGANSISTGLFTIAKGDNSAAMGDGTYAKSYGELAIGSYNDTLVTVNPSYFVNDTNRLFTVGNGTFYTPKTAFVIQQNGNVGVGSRKPMSTLEVGGAVAMPFKAISASITLDNTHHTLRFSGSTASQTVTLPTASTCTGRIYRIVNGGSVALGVSSYFNYSNSSTTSISSGSAIVLQSDGTSWFQIP